MSTVTPPEGAHQLEELLAQYAAHGRAHGQQRTATLLDLDGAAARANHARYGHGQHRAAGQEAHSGDAHARHRVEDGLDYHAAAHAAYAARGRRREAYQEIQYSLQQKHHLIGAKCAVVSYILVRAAGFVKRAGQNRHGLPF